jgi:acetyl-CoA carboxylase biotin carboxyl carrier protein
MVDKKSEKSKIDANIVRQLADLLDETGLNEIEYGTDEWHLRVAKNGMSPITVPIAPPSVVAEPSSVVGDSESHASHPGVIISPMVGTAYISPDPESPPFVKVGDTVIEGDTLILIEAMKVYNPIKAARSGTVTRVFINNGTPIEFGEPLMIIE